MPTLPMAMLRKEPWIQRHSTPGLRRAAGRRNLPRMMMTSLPPQALWGIMALAGLLLSWLPLLVHHYSFLWNHPAHDYKPLLFLSLQKVQVLPSCFPSLVHLLFLLFQVKSTSISTLNPYSSTPFFSYHLLPSLLRVLSPHNLVSFSTISARVFQLRSSSHLTFD